MKVMTIAIRIKVVIGIIFCFLRDLYERMTNMVNAKVRLNHAPIDFVKIRAIAIKSDAAYQNKGRSPFFKKWAPSLIKCNEKKNIIIKYPPKTVGEGNVPIVRFAINISFA